MRKKIFLICCEKSGNNILRQTLQELNKNGIDLSKCELEGVVFEDIANEFNIKQLFSPKQLAVLGIGDILMALPRILDRISDTAKRIVAFQPDLVLSVDAYEFCIRVAKKVQTLQTKQTTTYKHIEFWHIVAPSVWAYWSGRAKTLAKYYNHLFYLLPFEGAFFKPLEQRFEGHLFQSTFIGFPAVFQNIDKKITTQENLIGITLGSRGSEIQRHQKIILDTILRLKVYDEDLQFVIFATKDTERKIKHFFLNRRTLRIKNLSIISDELEKKQTMQKCKLIIAKSGTNNIEIGAFGAPMITYYKTSFLTYLFAKIFVKVKFVNLFNITLNKLVVPEFIQQQATADNIANYTIKLIEKPYLIDFQKTEVAKAIEKMKSPDGKTPIQIICEKLCEFLKPDCNKHNDNNKKKNSNFNVKKLKATN